MQRRAHLDCKILKADRNRGFNAASTGDDEAAFEDTLDNAQAEAGGVRR
jgi:hypothetical protein